MKELPKELTPELLSLVLGEEVVKIDGIGNGIHPSETTLCYREDDILGGFETSINIDTITKLMIEKIREHYDLVIGFGTTVCIVIYKKGGDIFNDVALYKHEDLFLNEVVLKATHWVATEKNML